MTFEEFKEQYNHLPVDLEEFASIIEGESGDEMGSCSEGEEYELIMQLQEQAVDYRKAMEALERTIEALELERG